MLILEMRGQLAVNQSLCLICLGRVACSGRSSANPYSKTRIRPDFCTHASNSELRTLLSRQPLEFVNAMNPQAERATKSQKTGTIAGLQNRQLPVSTQLLARLETYMDKWTGFKCPTGNEGSAENEPVHQHVAAGSLSRSMQSSPMITHYISYVYFPCSFAYASIPSYSDPRHGNAKWFARLLCRGRQVLNRHVGKRCSTGTMEYSCKKYNTPSSPTKAIPDA